jgi:mutator protein MutT
MSKVCTLLFLRRDNEVLLAMKKRGFGVGKWNGIGGKIEENESLEQALVRECQEEIDVTPLNFWQVAEHDFKEFHDGKPADMYVHVYFCDKWEGEPTETEEMAPKWFDINNIPYDSMWDDDKYWLPQVLDGDKLRAEFNVDEDDRVISHTITPVSSFQ